MATVKRNQRRVNHPDLGLRPVPPRPFAAGLEPAAGRVTVLPEHGDRPAPPAEEPWPFDAPDWHLPEPDAAELAADDAFVAAHDAEAEAGPAIELLGPEHFAGPVAYETYRHNMTIPDRREIAQALARTGSCYRRMPDLFSLPEWIGAQARHYREMDTELGSFLADELSRLETECRILGARTLADFHDRRAAYAAGREQKGGVS